MCKGVWVDFDRSKVRNQVCVCDAMWLRVGFSGATKKSEITKIKGYGATFMGLGAFVGGSE